MIDASAQGFAPLFARAASRVRARLAYRHAVTGAAGGAVFALGAAIVAWERRVGGARGWSLLLVVVGAAAGWAWARRRRWSDEDVALYLDAGLDANESIATALSSNEGRAHERAVSLAARALADGDRRRVSPRVWAPLQAVGPLAALGLVFALRLPVPAAPAHVDPPGVARVTVTDATGLDPIVKLANAPARDEAQRERLAAIAKEAAALKDALRTGLEKRDAQDRLARLHDAIDDERMTLGQGERRAGLEGAVARLERSAPTRDPARALGDHDLESMDREMERVANAREASDRALAARSLTEAADAARASGAPDVATALDEERRLLKERGERASELRDLAEAMKEAGFGDGEVGRKLDSLDRAPSDADARALAKAMIDAMAKLTTDERKKLAEKLTARAKAGRMSSDPDTAHRLAQDLSSADGRERLEDELRALANDATTSEEAADENALNDAQRGAGQAEDDVGGQGAGAAGAGIPIPVPNAAAGDSHGGGAGGSHDTGSGDHAGRTETIAGDTLKSRAHGNLGHAPAMPGGVTTFAPGRAGGTASTRGTGDLAAVGPREIEGIDKSDVPEEYREQVRQYFAP